MALVPFTGTISASVLNANFDDATATLTALAKVGQKDQFINLRVELLGSGTALVARSLTFTPQDDMELRIIALRAIDGTATRVITMTLTVENGDDDFLIDQTVSTTVTTVVGTATSRVDFRTTTNPRIKLLKGVPYTLTLSSNTAGTTTSAEAGVQLRTRRRPG